MIELKSKLKDLQKLSPGASLKLGAWL